MKLRKTYAYDDVTLIPAYSELSSRSDANPAIHGFKIPTIVSCMDTLGNQMKDCAVTYNIPFIAHRAFKTPEEQLAYFTKTSHNLTNVWFAIGSMQKYKRWIDYLLLNNITKFCVDMAHGDSKACIDTIKYLKNELKDINDAHIIAGNVATKEGFLRLKKAGADGIRVGIAAGQICSTAIETAMGVPILTSIIDCAKIKGNTWLIADGGVKCTGDIAKAIYFGADFVMIGKMFAATDCACGTCYNKNKEEIIDTSSDKNDTEKSFYRPIFPQEFEKIYEYAIQLDKIKHDNQNRTETCIKNLVAYRGYHGMASRAARRNIISYASVEGVEGLILYTGTTAQFINDTYLRLQASLSYGGAKNWTEFRKKVKACERSQAGIIAADVHLDVLTNK